MRTPLLRPHPVLTSDAPSIDQTLPAERAARQLRDGQVLRVSNHYRTGVQILTRLREVLPLPADDAPYDQRHAHRRTWRETSRRLLVPIIDRKLALRGSPAIGFLDALYPGMDRFLLPLVEVQALNAAWQQYQEGVDLAVLGHAVHPFFGTYAPTRHTHLELFGTWLSQYQGARDLAVDVGTGCGVLAFMLCNAGFAAVRATDNNPNAIESVRRDRKRRATEAPPGWPGLIVEVGDLLGAHPDPVDLVVFNPPWTRGPVEERLDQALVYEGDLFERFFTQAHARLAPQGRVVLLFSNLITLVQPDEPHPIEQELERGRFKLVQKLRRRVKPVPTADGRPRKTRERVEVWELAAN